MLLELVLYFIVYKEVVEVPQSLGYFSAAAPEAGEVTKSGFSRPVQSVTSILRLFPGTEPAPFRRTCPPDSVFGHGAREQSSPWKKVSTSPFRAGPCT